MKFDDGSADYTEPHWQKSPLREYPYLMRKGDAIRIKNARVKIPGTIAGSPRIRAARADGINVPSTVASLVSGTADEYEINNISASAGFPNKTAFYDPFDMTWEISRDNGSTWESAGTSRNYVYVSLVTPSAVVLYRTVVHLACKNPGATSANAALGNTWALFSTGSGPGYPETWDGHRLDYYRFQTTFAENLLTVGDLLLNRTGQCFAFRDLLRDAWKVNGITTAVNIKAEVIVSSQVAFFWVKTWTDIPPGPNRFFWFQSPDLDMRPAPLDGDYGHYDNGTGTAFKNNNALLGQGDGLNAPSQKAFGNHRILKQGNTYYDPSYGAQYSNAAGLQAKLDGYGFFDHVENGKRVFRWTPISPGPTVVMFTLDP